MVFTWTSPDPLNGTAKTRSIYITELQDAVNTRRAEISQAPLSFIDQNTGKKFRLDAIEELKTVTNQLAIDFGYTTGVQDPTLLGRPYVTITKKYGAYVCHYPIINDLRQILNSLSLKVSLYMDYVLNYLYPTEDRNLANLTVSVSPALKTLAKSQYSWNARCRVSCDSLYVYRAYPSGVGDSFIYIEDILTGVNIASKQITSFRARDICVDDTYVYVTGTTNLGGGINKTTVKRLDKANLDNLITLITIDGTGATYSFNQGSPSIICDETYLYVTGSKKEAPPGSPWGLLITPHGVIIRYLKSGGAGTEFLYRKNYVPPQPPGSNGTRLSAITIDDEYLYVNYIEENYPLVGPSQIARKILKIKRDTMTVFDNWNAGSHGDGRTALTMGNNYIYELSRAAVWGLPVSGLLTCYNKSGIILTQSEYVSGYYLNDISMDNRMACSDEYLAFFNIIALNLSY